MTHSSSFYDIPTATCNVNYWVKPMVLVKETTAEHIINATCRAMNVTKVALLSKIRSRNIVRAWNICMMIIRNRLKMSLFAIGKLFNRHHTSVMHSIECVANDLTVTAYRAETNQLIRSVIELL